MQQRGLLLEDVSSNHHVGKHVLCLSAFEQQELFILLNLTFQEQTESELPHRNRLYV